MMVEDPKVRWPAQLEVGPDGIGNSDGLRAPHHGGVDGGADPPLQDGDAGRRGSGRRGLPGGGVAARRARASTSCPTAGTGRTACRSATRRSSTCRPTPIMVEGHLIADAIAAIASIDPVMGGVDR